LFFQFVVSGKSLFCTLLQWQFGERTVEWYGQWIRYGDWDGTLYGSGDLYPHPHQHTDKDFHSDEYQFTHLYPNQYTDEYADPDANRYEHFNFHRDQHTHQ
jgi:hypothetical protein